MIENSDFLMCQDESYNLSFMEDRIEYFADQLKAKAVNDEFELIKPTGS